MLLSYAFLSYILQSNNSNIANGIASYIKDEKLEYLLKKVSFLLSD
jgi:hypothetical protein